MSYETEITAALGKRLKDAKERSRATWEELAEASGLSVSGVRKYLRGDGNMSIGKFYAIARALDIDPRATLRQAEDDVLAGPPAGISRNTWARIDPKDQSLIATHLGSDVQELTDASE